MALKIKLKPNETFIVNGCVMQNGPRRHSIIVLNFANIVREDDLITKDEATTPVKAIYYAIQSLLTNSNIVQDSLSEIQNVLAKIYSIQDNQKDKDAIMLTANYVSISDFYKALSALRPVMKKEQDNKSSA